MRANISVLAVLWCAVSAFGCFAIARASHQVVARSEAQLFADTAALTLCDHGTEVMQTMAQRLGFAILSSRITRDGHVVVTVQRNGVVSDAEATRSGGC